MSATGNKGLLDQILKLIEKAYRRGFQQGFHVARKGSDVTMQQVHAWRYLKPPKDVQAIIPPGMRCAGQNFLGGLPFRLSCELKLEDALLDSLLHDVYPDPMRSGR